MTNRSPSVQQSAVPITSSFLFSHLRFPLKSNCSCVLIGQFITWKPAVQASQSISRRNLEETWAIEVIKSLKVFFTLCERNLSMRGKRKEKETSRWRRAGDRRPESHVATFCGRHRRQIVLHAINQRPTKRNEQRNQRNRSTSRASTPFFHDLAIPTNSRRPVVVDSLSRRGPLSVANYQSDSRLCSPFLFSAREWFCVARASSHTGLTGFFLPPVWDGEEWNRTALLCHCGASERAAPTSGPRPLGSNQ